MIQSYLKGLKLRAALVFVVIHLGLVLAVYGLAKLSVTVDPQLSVTLQWLAAGVALLYGGMILGGLWLGWPLVSVAVKVRRLMRWREWIVEDLPAFLTALPVIIESIRTAVRAANVSPTASREPVASVAPEPGSPARASKAGGKPPPAA